ncbi:MAG: hypothetical protein SR1Q7_01215 [Quinella sp. 1Q7]|nr:hypothetical protein [Quinella sp. 1Q7]
MVAVTVNFRDEAFALLKKYADEKGLTPSELLRRTMLDHLEDEEDIREAEAILKEDTDEPLSHEEFWRRAGA